MNHTPLPYAIKNGNIVSGTVTVAVPHGPAGRYSDVQDEHKANAEFIVTACNCHYDLLEALDLMVDEKADYMRLNNLGDPETQQTIIWARAAIAKAKGA